jgi:nickel transport protein
MICTTRLCCFLGAFLIVLVTGATAEAHGTDYRLLDPESAIVVEFIYADNMPMSYAEILVYSPENDRIEYQNGRTDINGRFAFYPEISGRWSIQADDGTGHLQRVLIEIDPNITDETGMGSVSGRSNSNGHHQTLPRTWGIVLGISLIFNLFLGLNLATSYQK